MRVILGSDHAGFAFRRELAEWMASEGHTIDEVGAADESAYDYPDASDALAAKVLAQDPPTGILICGTGIGVSIRANRYRGIRAALCCSPETAALARQHNHANVLCLGARTTNVETAKQMVRVFLETEPSGEPRHQHRVSKLDRIVEASE